MSRRSARHSSSSVSCCSKYWPRLNCSIPSTSCGGGGSSQDIFLLSRGAPPPLADAAGVYLSSDDRKAAIEDSGMGRLRNHADSEEQAHHRLRGREDLEPGEPPA